MQSACKTFHYPASRMVEVEVETGFWTKTKRKVQQKQQLTSAEVLQNVKDFVDNVGPERLISVCELLRPWDTLPDESIWVVWYWEAPKETSEVTPPVAPLS